MHILISDLGVKIGENNQLYSIGRTSILLEWAEEGTIRYRMLLDLGLKSNPKENNRHERVLDTINLQRVERIMQDKVLGFDNGIQCFILSHCHLDHAGGYPWFFQMCKNKNIRPPSLYMTRMTRDQFVPFQNELYDLLEEPAKTTGPEYCWDKSIINEIANMAITKDYTKDYITIQPRPLDFDINLKFKSSGHIVGSAMTELDTIKYGESLGKILYTGDVCFRDGSFLVDSAKLGEIKEHYKAIIPEMTYIHHGFIENRKELEKYAKLKREDLKLILKDYIEKTLGKGGNLILLIYTIDRAANILSALRELIDADPKNGGIDIDLKGKIFFDTSSGRIITNEYLKAFEDLIRYGAEDALGYFRPELAKRCKQGYISFLQSDDKNYIYEAIMSHGERLEKIEKCRNGGYIFIATSATLEGGSALINGSYMHPDGWSGNLNNLFLLIGNAIPGTMAGFAIEESKKEESKKKGYIEFDLPFTGLEKGEEGEYKFYREWRTFVGRLEELGQFSAHANYAELQQLINGTNAEMYLVTHIGGHYGIDKIERHINDTFMSGIRPIYRKGMKLGKRRDVQILSSTNKVHIKLEPSKDPIILDENTREKFHNLCIKLKGAYNDKIKIDVINFLMSEYYKFRQSAKADSQ